MKKILIFIALLFSVFGVSINASAKCEYNEESANILGALDTCIEWTRAVNPWEGKNFTAEKWFKDTVGQITKNLMYIFWIIAVWAIAYGSLMLAISAWNDDKVNKWKNIIKWASFGFLIIVSAGWIITIIVNVIYWLAWWK